MNRKEILLAQLSAAYDQNTWFVSLKSALEGLTAEQASFKGDGSANSVREIVNHLTFWNTSYLRRFKEAELPKVEGGNDGTFKYMADADWESVLEELYSILGEWRNVLKECNDEKLDKSAYKNSHAPWDGEIAHLVMHNTHHAGQIVHIRKQFGNWDSKNGVD